MGQVRTEILNAYLGLILTKLVENTTHPLNNKMVGLSACDFLSQKLTDNIPGVMITQCDVIS